MVAQALFEARGENTIAIAPGNKLRVVEEHGSGWTYVNFAYADHKTNVSLTKYLMVLV